MANFSFILERLSSRAKNALIAAQILSEQLQHDHIGTEHLLYGIIAEKSSFAAEILTKSKATPEALMQEVESVNFAHKTHTWKPVLSENLKAAIEKAAIIASHYGYQFIGTEHFLYGLVNSRENTAKTILGKLDVNLTELEQNLMSVFENISKFPDMPQHEHGPMNNQPGMQPMANQNRGNMLEYFTTDLTAKAAKGNIDPVVGRKAEIDRMISILGRRTKNNPVLIGEAGVGKTAIAEGLALAISKREVPDSLLDKRILNLDLALIVAGSMFRGEFENRLKQIIEEVKNKPDVILFIDEIHTMVGAGATTGSLDAANILKPALARSELRVIGATTLEEYRKHIEHDAALERRFQPIIVEEPSSEEAIAILKGLRSNYEKHHRVKITDEAIKAAVEFSVRYIQDRFLPDKAIDLIDETAATLRMIHNNSKAMKQRKKIMDSLAALEAEKTKAVLGDDFPTAIHLRTQEEKLKKQLAEIEKQVEAENTIPLRDINAEDIAHTVSLMTKIPLTKLTETESEKLLNLEKILKNHIVGQDEAVSDLAKTIRRSRAGIAHSHRPIGSFVFLGPTGVGKTETAKVIAQELFGDADNLIRVDMSEFMERHNVSRLIGAPAGYVGYEEGGKLTEAVRRKPYAVVLFDEMEKAHPDVFNMLLQILEDGHLTDAKGKKVNFTNTIIIMTSNLGMQELTRQASKIGFAEKENKPGSDKAKLAQDYEKIKEQVLEMFRDEFRPEFLNRLDKIIVYKPLGLDELKKITQLHMQDLQRRLQKRGIQLKTTPAVIKFITEQSFDPEQGARFIRKNIQHLIEDPLAEKIIGSHITEGSTITTEMHKDKIGFAIQKKREKTLVAA